METNNLLAPLFFVLIRLMGGAILKFGLKKMPLPYTVGLFAFGLLIGTFDRIGWLESIPSMYLEPHNNQKQSEISKRKSLITNTFYKLTLFGCFLSLPKFPHIFDTYF